MANKNDITVVELKAGARKKSLRGYSTLNKAGLIQILSFVHIMDWPVPEIYQPFIKRIKTR